MSFLSAFLPSPPDPASSQPFAQIAILHVLYYVLAVLAILPATSILKLAILPAILWQAWRIAVNSSLGSAIANLTGPDGAAQIDGLKALLMSWILEISLKSIAWTFTKRPLRRYNPPPSEGQLAAPVERPLSIPNVLLDAFDLIFNKRGIGWSWSHNPFPKTSTWSTSIPVILAKLLLNYVENDASNCLLEHFRPSVANPPGDTIFDPSLSIVPQYACAAFYTVCGAMVLITNIDVYYYFATLIGRILLRQSAWQWPPDFNHPWMSTSVTELWSVRWHQQLRYVFVTFGSRPGGALLGRAGAVMGAFAVSAVLHYIMMCGAEFRYVGGFFLLMGVGVVLEHAFKVVTARRVGGIWGWVWAMTWTIAWGTLFIDAGARRGMFAFGSISGGFRPVKLLVDAIISRYL